MKARVLVCALDLLLRHLVDQDPMVTVFWTFSIASKLSGGGSGVFPLELCIHNLYQSSVPVSSAIGVKDSVHAEFASSWDQKVDGEEEVVGSNEDGSYWRPSSIGSFAGAWLKGSWLPSSSNPIQPI